jgi:hypothetical protein
MHVLDLITALWILAIFSAVFFWMPARLAPRRQSRDLAVRIAGNLVRAALGVTIAVFLLASLKVLNALVVLVLCGGALLMIWLRQRTGAPRSLLQNLQAATIGVIRSVETWSLGERLLTRKRRPVPSGPPLLPRWLGALQGKQILFACLAVVLIITVVLRAEHALRELRFDQPEQYGALLRARELLLNFRAPGVPLVFPAMIAVTSLLSGADAAQVTRFLSPALGVLLVLATGLLIRVCCRVRVASVAAMYCLGAAFVPRGGEPVVAVSALEKMSHVFRHSLTTIAGNAELELGLLFLLLALVLLADWYQNASGWLSLFDFGCCLVLVGVVSQFLLLLLVLTAAAILLRPAAGLLLFVVLCYGMATYAAFSTGPVFPHEALRVLPVAAALAIGGFLALIEAKVIGSTSQGGEAVLLLASLAIAALWLPPRRSAGQYLEYDAAARQSQAIVQSLPRQRWAVAAPVEQLAHTFGLGGYEDLAQFVQKYEAQVSSPEFRFPEMREHLFIYVEKRPFQVFGREPATVSYPLLMDSTYRNYRSPGGRASLELAALQLCEQYRQYHSGVDVFFEDENLRIYHVRRLNPSESRAAR